MKMEKKQIPAQGEKNLLDEALEKIAKRGFINKDEVYFALTGRDFYPDANQGGVCPTDIKILPPDREKAVQIIRTFGRDYTELPIYKKWKAEHGDWPEDAKYYLFHIHQIEQEFEGGRDISPSVEDLLGAMLCD